MQAKVLVRVQNGCIEVFLKGKVHRPRVSPNTIAQILPAPLTSRFRQVVVSVVEDEARATFRLEFLGAGVYVLRKNNISAFLCHFWMSRLLPGFRRQAKTKSPDSFVSTLLVKVEMPVLKRKRNGRRMSHSQR